MRRTALLLLLLGSLRMIGDLAGVPVLVGLGAASGASPAPKVFTALRGMEPYSTRFFLEWEDLEGETRSLPLTPEVYRRLEGPYNRRNAYGAVLAAAPVLLEEPLTREMTWAVASYALSGEAPVLRELGIDPDGLAGRVRIRYRPVPAMPMSGLATTLELPR